jgi:hypothetical protein
MILAARHHHALLLWLHRAAPALLLWKRRWLLGLLPLSAVCTRLLLLLLRIGVRLLLHAVGGAPGLLLLHRLLGPRRLLLLLLLLWPCLLLVCRLQLLARLLPGCCRCLHWLLRLLLRLLRPCLHWLLRLLLRLLLRPCLHGLLLLLLRPCLLLLVPCSLLILPRLLLLLVVELPLLLLLCRLCSGQRRGCLQRQGGLLWPLLLLLRPCLCPAFEACSSTTGGVPVSAHTRRRAAANTQNAASAHPAAGTNGWPCMFMA